MENINDIIKSYDNERYKNDKLFNSRKKELYEKHPKLKEYDYQLIDLYVDLSLAKGEKDKKINELQALKHDYMIENKIDEHYNEPIYTCKWCKDTGFIDGKKCKCYKEKELQLFSDNFNFKKISEKYDLDAIDYSIFEQDVKIGNGKSYLDYIKDNVNNIKNEIDKYDHVNVFFHGDAGVGKTFLAKNIGAYFYKKNKTVIYLTMTEFVDELINGYKNVPKYGYDIEALVDMADMVIFDDLGNEYNTEYTLSRIRSLIDRRLENKKSTIICSNLSKEDIIDRYTDWIASRLFQEYYVVGFSKNDLRIKKNELRKGKNE